ncbi:Ig-like domain repeat protein [Clostridium intestinale]|uniref:Ig-like domain repeat protein n=1 Tax=Clostridium intestinale TaxID=36845 RepID=A0A7D6ZZW1_9CLOT|nr:Ig-like domain repeat protein [Clostridium intestinale]QLY81482.1 Ig-like domain repeat protein [Clostridium intestinale]
MLFIGLNFIYIKVEAEQFYTTIVNNQEYTNPNDIPSTIYYDAGGYQGTLYLQERRQVSGEESRYIEYSEPVSYVVADFCVWNKNTYYMNYVGSTGMLPDTKSVTQNGYTFTVSLVDKDQTHLYITKYAAANYEVRKHSSYSINGDWFTVSETAWIGSSNVVHGAQYHTADHYYNARYSGWYLTNDTRRYKGVYAGTVYNNRPVNDSYGIEESPFSDYRGYWVNSNSSFVIWSRAYAETRNDYYRPNRIYFSLQNQSGYEYGAILTSIWQEMNYYRSTGNIVNEAKLLDKYFSNEGNATANSRLRMQLAKDGMKINYKFTSSKDAGGYSEASNWKDMFTVNSDGYGPTLDTVYAENITPSGFDVVVKNVRDVNSGSGLKSVQAKTYINGDWQNTSIDQNVNAKDGDTLKFHIDTSMWNNFTGNYTVDIRAWDNVGNGGDVLYSLPVYVPYWTTPSTWANGVFKDNNGAPGEGVYTDSYGYKWVKPNENFFVGANGKSNSKDQQVNELHTLIYNVDNQSEQQLVKAGIPRGQVWADSFWQDIKLVNTIQFVGNYGSARRNDKMEMDAKGLNMESYFKFKLTKDNMDYYQGTKALCIDGGQYYWSNDWGFDMYNYIKTDGTAPTVSFYPEDNDWTNSEIEVNTYISDERSGVKTWEYRTSSNNGGSYGNWISIDSTKNSYDIKLSSQGKWMIQIRATDNVGNSNIVTSGPYKIDRTEPSGTFTPNSSELSILEQKVTFKPSDEGGSGVDYWEYSISRDDGETWDYESRYYGDSQEEILLTDIAKCKIQVTIKDKAGNTGIVTSGTYNIIVPDPLNGKLVMKKYDFQEYEDLNGNGEKDINEPLKPVYWVKPESEFRIYTEGYFPSSYGIYPTRSYVLYARDGKVDLSKSARQYSEEKYSGTDGDEYPDYFYNLDNGGLDFSNKDDKNYISHTHVAKAIEESHGSHFKLFYISSFFHGPIEEYHSDYKDSGIWLNVDGKPPTGNGLVEIDYKTLNMTITANDIKDSDSGVNSVWAMIYPYDPDSTSENSANINDFDGDTEYKNSDKMKKKLIRESNGNYKFELNAYDDAFKSEMVKVVICAKDNVGNKSIIKEENVDLFTLKARIVPLNNMDYSSNNPPTLEEGQAAVLIMEVTGEVERLDIEFSHDLSEKDGTLNKTITLNPLEKYKRVDNNFIVPLYCGEDRYIVEVVAHRKSKERYASPEFIVSDSVLNGIKTRIR